MLAQRRHESVGAVFTSRQAAGRAVGDLARIASVESDLEDAVNDPTIDMVFDADPGRQVARRVLTAIIVGIPVAAVALTTTLTLFVDPGAAGVGGMVAAGVIGGAFAGIYFGAFFGLVAAVGVIEEEQDWERVPLRPGELLVIAHGDGRLAEVVDMLGSHGGRLIGRPAHIS
jgi:hypothetical protein